jgi:hypothetical protein
MSTITISSGGSGEVATVVDSSVQVREVSRFDQAMADGLAYSWSSLTYDMTAADTILGVEVTTADYDLYIHEIHVTADVAGQVVVHTSSGVTMAGTAVNGINLDRSNTTVCALATAKADETGNGQAAATYSGRVHTTRYAADGVTIIPFNGALIVPYNYMVGVDLAAESAACNCTIIGYFVPTS